MNEVERMILITKEQWPMLNRLPPPRVLWLTRFSFVAWQTCVWADIADVQKSYLAPLGDTLRATRIQYHAELGRKQEESKGTGEHERGSHSRVSGW